MEIFDKLGKKASEAYKATADKTGKIAKETKLKLKMGDLKSQINDIYEEIGKKVYENHVREEDISIEKELEEQCIKIDVLSDEIESILKETLSLKDKKQCQKCYKEIEKEFEFCPSCGEKQSKEIEQEEVILKDFENEEDNEDKQSVEEIKSDEQQKDNLQKTVEIESDVKSDNNKI